MHVDVANGLLWFAVFLGSTVCHEAAHAWAALKLGDDTAARGGQVSLNPWPHVRREPFGMVVVPLVSWFAAGWMIGWASAPYDPAWARQWPKRAALMAIAGPAANLVLMLTAAWLIRIGVEWHVFVAPWSLNASHLADAVASGPWEIVARVLSVTLSLNLLLCVFNLLPLPPLDGSSVPLLLLPASLAEKYSHALQAPFLRYAGLLLASRSLGPFFPSLLLGAGRLLHPSAHYI